MAGRTKVRSLALWMNGLPVGHWELIHGAEQLVYRDDWIANPQGRPLSLSLPFLPGNRPHRGPAVAAFFDNLLPDSLDIRKRIAARYKTEGTDAFAMLAELGRDCVGAIQMLPPDEVPEDLASIRGQALNEAQIADRLRKITATPVPGQYDEVDDLRLSIAGAQEKSALLLHKGEWILPEGSTPTTHIFKLPMGLVGGLQADMRTSVENEWLSSKIVAAYDLPIAHCDIAWFEDQKVLIVERFDRRLSHDGKWILRLPQEDMCQATGTDARLKYQADGGPGIDRIMEVLARSVESDQDRRNFFKTQILFWLLAAPDGHAKNFSIAHLANDQYRATPLYDILSAHPIIGTKKNQVAPQKAKLAMGVHGKSPHYRINEILPRHWIAQGARVGFNADQVTELINELIQRTPEAITAVQVQLPEDFPKDIAETIFGGLTRHSQKLARFPDEV